MRAKESSESTGASSISLDNESVKIRRLFFRPHHWIKLKFLGSHIIRASEASSHGQIQIGVCSERNTSLQRHITSYMSSDIESYIEIKETTTSSESLF